MLFRIAILLFAAGLASFAAPQSTSLPQRQSQDAYAGAAVCATCHRQIADTQAKTAMANTWVGKSLHGRNLEAAALKFDETPKLHYALRQTNDGLTLSAGKQSLPVRTIVGGQRHGLSFLLGIDSVGGLSLERPAMIEARYALSHAGSLVLSPGFLKDTPDNTEDELGRVLSPNFEERCQVCHGKPGTLGAGHEGGVRCESCHGPSAAHVSSVSSAGQTPGQTMVRPVHLDVGNSMAVCAQCHSGLSATPHSDPMPEELLVSSQVPALRNSECFIQSGEQLTCTACHNPHEDSKLVTQTSVTTCLRCHSVSVPQHAAICPINRTEGCVGCHMPTVPSDSFRLTDHWIRVHPESGPMATKADETLRTQVVPKREYLRLIAVESDEKMSEVKNRMAQGESFGKVAHDLSIDPTAPGGGFIGDVKVADMDPRLAAAAARLSYGADSDVIQLGANRMLLHRLSRDFKWQANKLFGEAAELDKRGDRKGAIAKNQQALDVYPYLLRGLVLMGTMLGQAGDAAHAAEVLGFAAQSYPQDSASQFDLALTLGKQPELQIQALKRTIEMDPDLVAAYQTLGAVLYSTGQRDAAIATFRQGLQIDPLSASLYYDLGLALKDQGDATGSTKALSIASQLDPAISAKH